MGSLLYRIEGYGFMAAVVQICGKFLPQGLRNRPFRGSLVPILPALLQPPQGSHLNKLPPGYLTPT